MLQLGMLGLVFLCGVILVAVRGQRVEKLGMGKGGVHCNAEALPESGVLDRHSVRCVFAIGLAKSERKRGGPDIVGPG